MAKSPTMSQQIASTAKAILPEVLHQPLRLVWRSIYRAGPALAEWWLYLTLWFSRVVGRTYLQWYAKTLDDWVNSRDPEFLARKRAALQASGADDLAILKQFGLKPESTLHEFGCGQLRSALHFAEYLNPGNFSANDASQGRIDLGLCLFGDRLNPRRPQFIANPDNSFDWLAGRRFDFIWCHAVFGHMPPEDVEEVIRNVRKAMHSNSMFLFSYDEPRLQIPGTDKDIVRIDSRNWLQSFAFFSRVAGTYGLQIKDVSLVTKPYRSYRPHICLAQMTLLGTLFDTP
jgi:SAM-dependent methyltransferase